jgi:hypothetical protein
MAKPPEHGPQLRFKGGEPVQIEVAKLDPVKAERLGNLDLTGAIVVAATLGPLVMVRLKDRSTHWVPSDALTEV